MDELRVIHLLRVIIMIQVSLTMVWSAPHPWHRSGTTQLPALNGTSYSKRVFSFSLSTIHTTHQSLNNPIRSKAHDPLLSPDPDTVYKPRGTFLVVGTTSAGGACTVYLKNTLLSLLAPYIAALNTLRAPRWIPGSSLCPA